MELFSFSISRIMFGKLTFFSSYFSFKNIRGNLGPVSLVSSSVNFRGQRTDLASQFSCGINLYLLRQRTTFFCHVGDGIGRKNENCRELFLVSCLVPLILYRLVFALTLTSYFSSKKLSGYQRISFWSSTYTFTRFSGNICTFNEIELLTR